MERFYHLRVRAHGGGRVLNNGGATVHLSSIEGDPLHLTMRVAYCNPSDVFCKKEGRDHCLGRPAREEPNVTRRNPETGEAYSTTAVWPAVLPAEAKVVSLRELPSELGKVWKTVHKRSRVQTYRDTAPDFDHRIREWLPRG